VVPWESTKCFLASNSLVKESLQVLQIIGILSHLAFVVGVVEASPGVGTAGEGRRTMGEYRHSLRGMSSAKWSIVLGLSEGVGSPWGLHLSLQRPILEACATTAYASIVVKQQTPKTTWSHNRS